MTSVPKRLNMEREFHAHRARADDVQRLRHGGQIEDFDIGKDVVVGLQAGQHARFGSRGDKDVLGFEGLDAFVGLDFDLARAFERAEAL